MKFLDRTALASAAAGLRHSRGPPKGTLDQLRFAFHVHGAMSHPLLYEINTRCWLRELSDKTKASITLASVPESEISGWEKRGFSHIWLMGVWTTGQKARAEA